MIPLFVLICIVPKETTGVSCMSSSSTLISDVHTLSLLFVFFFLLKLPSNYLHSVEDSVIPCILTSSMDTKATILNDNIVINLRVGMVLEFDSILSISPSSPQNYNVQTDPCGICYTYSDFQYVRVYGTSRKRSSLSR